MKAVSLMLCICFALSLGTAQPRNSRMAKAGPFRLSSSFGTPVVQAQDTLRVLALMVQFKKDVDARTSGDGEFMLAGSQNQIDPPPHNSTFVSNKLRFLTNYYKRVSNGSLILLADVFSPLVTLADSMAAYSPQRAGSNEPLGKLIVDGWTAANSANPSFPFSLYDVFIIVHAGVGRDINVVSILGFDPTPYDLPSLVIDLPALRQLLKDPAYAGVPVSGGTFRIGHSLILPETETRVFGPNDTLQLSTNGLFAASLGSFLGLPDLFDTKTGRSGIGQFGLMDGASIFAYNGLFPPEPSAWEKIRLGWTTPIVLTDTAQSVSVPAVGLTNTGQDSIFKVPITATEYFLIENRSRDPNGNGQTLTLVQNGVDITRFFGSDTAGFFFNDVRSVAGSLVDAEDFDWAISGDMTQAGFEGGGILLWHIDDDIIAQHLDSNTVNADPLRRGVDLEEADGSQDIGQAYEFLQPGSGTETGWPLDQWFAGNGAPPYRNIFDASSFPASRSNSGALSHVAIRNFSANAPRMTLTVEVGNMQLQRLNGLSLQLSPSLRSHPPTVVPTAIIVSSDDSVFAFQKNGLSKTGNPNGLLSPIGGRLPLAAFEGIRTYVIGAQDSTLYIWDLDTTTAGVSSSVTLLTATLGTVITSGPMVIDSLGTPLVVVGAENGSVWKMQLDGAIHGSANIAASPITGLLANPVSPGTFFCGTQNTLILGATTVSLPQSIQGWYIAGGQIPGGVMVAAAEKGGRRIIGFDGSLATRLFDTEVGEGSIIHLIVADVDNDGRNDVVVTAGTRVYAYNYKGILLDHFPYRLADGGEFTGSPLVADADGNGTRDLIGGSTRGVVYAYGLGGQMIGGFPFQIASPGAGSLSLFETEGGMSGILSVNESGSIAAWERNQTHNPVQGDWRGFLSDAAHGSFNIGPSSGPVIQVSGFLPKERVYNWPNPVYGSSTNIRFFTTEPARIVVRIFDLAGESVTELKGDSPGGIDSEIVWDVSGIQSGVYFAHVEASAGARTDAVIFKIAVVK
jgi:hypothetical protein